MWTPGLGELLIIMVIVLVMFGGGKLAGLGKSLGTAISEFKDAVQGAKETKEKTEDPPAAKDKIE